MRFLIITIFIITAVLTGCAKKETPPPVVKEVPVVKAVPVERKAPKRVSPADYRELGSKLEQLIPAGWKIYDRVNYYTPESLYEIINGSAELYLSYEVVALTYANLTHDRNPNYYLDISVYDMGSPTNAFGIYSVERAPNQQRAKLGRASYWSGSSLFTWHGNYYIIIALAGPESELKKIGLKLAQDIAAQLEDTGESVRGLEALPKKGLVENSVKYFRTDAMGLAFLKNTYIARYRVGRQTTTTFYSRMETAEEARHQFNQYLDHVREYGKIIRKQRRRNTTYVECKTGDATDIIFLKGKVMGGVISITDSNLVLRHLIDFSNQLSK